MDLIRSNISNLWGDDDEEFMKVYNEYKTPIYKYSKYIVGQHEIAQEIRNDALMEVYNHGPFSNADKLRNFLYKVAKNKCVDHLRRIKAQKGLYNRFQKTLEESEDQIEKAIFKAERIYRLYKLIQTLPAEVKKAMMGYYFDLLEVEEIAQKENKSVNTIRKQLQQGKDELRKYPGIDKLLIITVLILFM